MPTALYTSHKLQPCDVVVFGPLKTAYRDQIGKMYHAGATTVNKEHFTALFSPARVKAMTKKNILAGWAKTGLFPFNPDRVLRGITKPVAALAVPIRTDVGACSQDQVTLVQTPVTPVSSEGLTSLLNLIAQDPHDEASKQRYERLVQKLSNTA